MNDFDYKAVELIIKSTGTSHLRYVESVEASDVRDYMWKIFNLCYKMQEYYDDNILKYCSAQCRTISGIYKTLLYYNEGRFDIRLDVLYDFIIEKCLTGELISWICEDIHKRVYLIQNYKSTRMLIVFNSDPIDEYNFKFPDVLTGTNRYYGYSKTELSLNKVKINLWKL